MSASSWTNLLDLIYPTGTFYLSYNSTSPAANFGGTWVQVKDRFLLGVGTKKLGTTSGEEAVTLTIDQIPAHFHSNKQTDGTACWPIEVAPAGAGFFEATVNAGQGSSTSVWTENRDPARGGGKEHTNMPPYLCIYMWRRTA